MLSITDMLKAQSRPAGPLRYGEHFYHVHSLCDWYPVLHTVSIIPHCGGRDTGSLGLIPKEYRSV